MRPIGVQTSLLIAWDDETLSLANAGQSLTSNEKVSAKSTHRVWGFPWDLSSLAPPVQSSFGCRLDPLTAS
jgi:hypothetical protein